jgi:hypothetical protein
VPRKTRSRSTAEVYDRRRSSSPSHDPVHLWLWHAQRTPELVTRSLTLLRAFVVLSAVILAVGAVVLGTVLTGALRTQAIEDAEASLTQYTGAVIGPRLVRDGEVVVGADATGIVQADLDQRPEILSVKVWRPDGVL